MKFKRVVSVLLTLTMGSGLNIATAAQGALRVGAARVDHNGVLGKSQTGKYDHEYVYVRAIVLDNGAMRAALISYEGPESGFNMGATLKSVADQVKCPVENVLITHTHTHSSQSGKPNMMGNAPPVATPSKEILDAVTKAAAKLQPARMAFGNGASYLNVNRDAIDPDTRKWTQGTNLDGLSDKTVAVLSFYTPAGKPIAVFVNYAAHPIDGFVLGVVSGDFPGAMSRYVEKNFGDDVVVAFSQGASGDQSPMYLRPSTNAMASRAGNEITGFQMNREDSEGPLRVAVFGANDKTDTSKVKPAADPKVIDDLFRFIESEGQIFGEEVIRVMSLTRNTTTDSIRISGFQKAITCAGRARTNGNPMDPNTREGQAATYEDAAPITLRVGMLGIGSVAMTSINGETYTAIGNRVKKEAPMTNTVIVTLANERVRGYIPDDASYGHQTFQVLDSKLKPGCAETGIANAVVELQTLYLNGQ